MRMSEYLFEMIKIYNILVGCFAYLLLNILWKSHVLRHQVVGELSEQSTNHQSISIVRTESENSRTARRITYAADRFQTDYSIINYLLFLVDKRSIEKICKFQALMDQCNMYFRLYSTSDFSASDTIKWNSIFSLFSCVDVSSHEKNHPIEENKKVLWY